MSLLTRTTTRDVCVAGRQIPKGNRVAVGFAAANRDPTVFEEPNCIRIGRTPNRHLAFGHGVHECVGAALARLQARVALETLLARFGEIELVDARPAWRDGFAQRGLRSLKLRVSSH